MNTPISIEFFPPKTEVGSTKLQTVAKDLAALNPEYFSVTYGAGGSTRDNTYNTVLSLRQAGYDVAPHLSFGADSKETILALLQSYVDAGINRLVALRGDPPSGVGTTGFVYASELVAFTREHFGEHFNIAVACYPEVHPEANGYQQDVSYLKEKFDAGANMGITQYFYNIEAFFYFMDECYRQGIKQPIYPGIMPITNMNNLIRFSDACGADIPRWIRKAGSDLKDDDLIKFGEDVVVDLCDQLMMAGIPGIHFYSMNQSQAVLSISEKLGFDIASSEA